MNPYRYPYGYHPAPPPVDPGGVTPITSNQQGVAMMSPQGYISAVPSPAYPVYYGGGGSSAAGWVHSARRHCSLHLGYALWSGHGWRRVPGCDRYTGCLSVGRACDHALTNAVPVSWVRVCLDHLHALCLQG